MKQTTAAVIIIFICAVVTILHDLFPNIDVHQYNYIVINKNLLITI